MSPEVAALHPDIFTVDFWKGAREHRLTVPQCSKCGAFTFPPNGFCHVCRKQEFTWIDLPGTGTVFSFTVTRQALIPQFAEYVPFVVAVIQVDGADDVRLITNIVSVDPADVQIGSRVRVQWDDIHENTTIPRFVLDAQA
jgi:uncharacterized OB-fold protein